MILPILLLIASPLTLTWDAPPNDPVAGYYLCTGTVQGHETNCVDVGSSREYTLTVTMTPLYAVAYAYDSDKKKGDPSNEVIINRKGNSPNLRVTDVIP